MNEMELQQSSEHCVIENEAMKDDNGDDVDNDCDDYKTM